MWLGTEDGHIHIFNCTDNIRIKKNKDKFVHSSPVLAILYADNKVFVSLGSGNIVVYVRSPNGVWDKSGAKILSIGTAEHPIRKMLVVGSRIWCATRNVIKIVDVADVEVKASFTVVVKEDDSKSEAKPDELGRSILAMSHCGMAVWVVVERSAKVLAFHTSPQSRMCGSEVSRGAEESFIEVEPLIDLKVTGVVNKVLAGCDDIIRQHKAACLRITTILACKDMLWVGTSAGVIVTMHLPYINANTSKITVMPHLIGNQYGHSGHVRFLTCVEMTPEFARIPPFGKSHGRFQGRSSKAAGGEAASHANISTLGVSSHASKMLVISGGDGYEDFSSSGHNEMVGREDSTNHLLLWQV